MATRRAAPMAAWRRQAIHRMIAVRRSMLALVAGIPEAEVLRPRTLDQWSVKDVLGHLLSCDEETLRRFRLIERGRDDRIVWFESMAFADRFNARTVARTRRYGLAELRRRMARVRAELIERLGACRRGRSAIPPTRTPLWSGSPCLAGLTSRNT